RAGRVVAGRAQDEGGPPAAMLVVVERREVGAVTGIAGKLAGRDAGMSHHPGHEGAGPRLRRAAVPVGMPAAAPIVADLAGERLAAFADAAAVDVAAGVAAI